MDVGTEKLRGFFDSSPKGADRQVGEPLSMELFHSEAMGKHVDDLSDPDAGAFYSQFAACPVRTGLKVFILHSMSILARRLEKVNKINKL
jgi:hypothetical protein